MNELIQALGQYTEALENKITSLTQQLAEQAKLIEELRIKIEELSAAPAIPEKPEEPETPEKPEIPEVPESPESPEKPEILVQEPELALEPEIPEKPESPEETKKVDIRQMISLGDRFLFQRELFGQNGEKMQRALDEINQCATEQEALDYVEQHFEWDKKSPTYELFIHAIHRSHTGR